MSSFKSTFKHKATGEIHEVFCHDDYFGNHNYGYHTPDGTVLTEEQFRNQYERVEK